MSVPDHRRLSEIIIGTRPIARNRNAVIRYIRNTYPLVRTRTYGPVGPEPDWSIRFARIPNDWVGKHGNFPTIRLMQEAGLRNRLEGREFQTHAKCCEHGELDLLVLSDDGVRAWTKWAHEHGVTFNGTQRYNIPRNPKRIIYTGKTNVRSSEAALRRSRKRHFKWQSTKTVRRILNGTKTDVSAPVVLALRKIYSNVEYEPFIGKILREKEKVASKATEYIYSQKYIPPHKRVSKEEFLKKVGKPTKGLEPNDILVSVLGGDVKKLHKVVPRPHHTKYWYFLRKRGIFRFSEHHPYGDEYEVYDFG